MTEAKVSSLEHPSEALGLDVRVRQGVYEEKPGPQLETSIVIQVSGGKKCNDLKTGGGSMSCLHWNSIGCREEGQGDAKVSVAGRLCGRIGC